MATAETAPPRLPNVFITPDTDPLKLPPISRQIAQDTATVSSSPANATTSQNRAVLASRANTPWTRQIAAMAKTITETRMRPFLRSFQTCESLSERHPPAAL